MLEESRTLGSGEGGGGRGSQCGSLAFVIGSTYQALQGILLFLPWFSAHPVGEGDSAKLLAPWAWPKDESWLAGRLVCIHSNLCCLQSCASCVLAQNLMFHMIFLLPNWLADSFHRFFMNTYTWSHVLYVYKVMCYVSMQLCVVCLWSHVIYVYKIVLCLMQLYVVCLWGCVLSVKLYVVCL